ncbi:hypothetical protein G4O51_00730 [Candidatus Bathyarchaeota archaeon A05DMB-2]|jgi:hypothetical protein|nr:hypothetical protein [Candidatus Bathyarchaeota archaeon A05DMB-2]
MSTTITYLRIRRAIDKNSECFLCELETEIEQRYFDNYLQELVMDYKAREKIIQSRGFCNNHSYKILVEANKPTISDGHGIALIMQSITKQLIQDVSEQNNLHKNAFSKIIANEKKCPACIHITESMEIYTKKTAELLASSDEISKLFKESKGFCIPHFAALAYTAENVEANRRQAVLQLLSEVEKENLFRLHSELAEYVKRQSYEFSEEERAAVTNILLRSVKKIVGKRGTLEIWKTPKNE